MTPTYGADMFADAIAAHRNAKYGDAVFNTIDDAEDKELYGVLIWWETWKDHADPRDPYGPLPEN